MGMWASIFAMKESHRKGSGGGGGGGREGGGGRGRRGALVLALACTFCSDSLALSLLSPSLSCFTFSSSPHFPLLAPCSMCKPNRRPPHRTSITYIRASSVTTVDNLLNLVSKGLEGKYTQEESARIAECIDELEEEGRGRLYLQDPQLVGYYRVQYVQDVGRGRPVGGNFRYTAAGRS
eukprot:317572-Hanusia_phi.AAC.3